MRTTRPKRSSFLPTLLPLFLAFSCLCQGAFVNRSIDDSLGDSATGFKPIYNPTSPWADQTCAGCAIQPDRSMAYDGTWTAATYNPQLQNISITLEFTGIAVWVFFILANANQHGPTITTNTNCNFTLDGSHVGTFVHNPDMSTLDLVYNASVFSASGLSNSQHQLVISTNDVPFNVFVNFDYAIYTAVTSDTPTSAASTPSTQGASTPSNQGTSTPSTQDASTPSSNSGTSISIPSFTSLTSTASSSSASGESSASSNSTSSSTPTPTSAKPASSNNSLASPITSSSSNSTGATPSNQANRGSSSSRNVGAIVGAVLGGFAFTTVLVVILLLLFRRLSKSKKEQALMVPRPMTRTNVPPTEAFRDDETTTSHLPWQSTVFSSESHGGLAAAAGSGSDPAPNMRSSPSTSDLDEGPSAMAPLLPVRRGHQPQLSGQSITRDEVSALRQMEINQRLQSAQREMENLTSRRNSSIPPSIQSRRPAETGQEVEDLWEQLRVLRGQIEHLQMQRQSDWAMGLSDEPPPAYVGTRT